MVALDDATSSAEPVLASPSPCYLPYLACELKAMILEEVKWQLASIIEHITVEIGPTKETADWEKLRFHLCFSHPRHKEVHSFYKVDDSLKYAEDLNATSRFSSLKALMIKGGWHYGQSVSRFLKSLKGMREIFIDLEHLPLRDISGPIHHIDKPIQILLHARSHKTEKPENARGLFPDAISSYSTAFTDMCRQVRLTSLMEELQGRKLTDRLPCDTITGHIS
ncbi:hypothetical protein CC78DRAFT_613899 [Lojkania enalia]|uniref:Uncharacterized protein n=1 Tax=Lojkania enalia TaxID=147567 RepID=A0A9P4KEN5_9PLEO|nr:hypothetical protein CC78DRAFT_613899 [Didymosphaeria enalia]